MNTQSLARRPRPHQWWVYETSDRWIRAVRRFAPSFDQGWDFVNHKISSELLQSIRHQSIRHTAIDPATRRIILWQIDRANLASVATAIAHLSARRSAAYERIDLQIAATQSLSPTIEMSLSELGIDTFVRNPEQLPSLESMIRAHLSAN